MTGIDSDTTIGNTLREQAAPGSGPGAPDPRGSGQPAAGDAPEPAPEAPQESAAGPVAPADGSSQDARPAGGGPGREEGAAGEPEDADEALGGDVQELVAVAAQRDEYLALAQRTQADFENYRKRVAREAAAASERGAIRLARELLPALDNLDRALEEAGATGENGQGRDSLIDGLRLVRSQLADALGRVGIEEFSPLGEPFDPNRHEAMAQRPPADGEQSGAVVEVYQSGYRLGESIIRPARVLVTS